MVYGKIIFNNIKEYTPSWIKTIPYSQTTKPLLRRQPQIVGRINADPKVKQFWVFLRENVQNYPFLWQFFILGISFAWFHVCYDPWLQIYLANNPHVRIRIWRKLLNMQDIRDYKRERSLESAIAKEKAFQKKKQELEDAE